MTNRLSHGDFAWWRAISYWDVYINWTLHHGSNKREVGSGENLTIGKPS